MHLRCAYCQLDLNLVHFQAGAQLVTSICDICQLRGWQPAQFSNQQLAFEAQAQGWTLLGLPASVSEQPAPLKLTRQQRQSCAGLVASFDALPDFWQTPARQQQFYQRIIQWQDHPLLAFTGNVPRDLRQLGCEVTGLFDKNTLDFTTRTRVREYYQFRCQYCGRYGDSVDHKEPVALSNDNSWDNLTLSCRECNRLKGDMPYAQFQQWNQEIAGLSQQLVADETALHRLTERQRKLQQRLAAQRHLQMDIQAPALQQLRQEIKIVQGLLDGTDSDYQKRIQLRHDYITSHYQVWRLAQAAARFTR